MIKWEVSYVGSIRNVEWFDGLVGLKGLSFLNYEMNGLLIILGFSLFITLLNIVLVSVSFQSYCSFTFHTSHFYFPATHAARLHLVTLMLVLVSVSVSVQLSSHSHSQSQSLFFFIIFFSSLLSLQYLQTYYKPLSSLPISSSYNFFLFSSLLAFSANNLISLYFVLEFLSLSLIGLMFLIFHSEIVNSLI